METKDQKEAIAESITRFAQENNLKIHPGQNPATWADRVIIKGGCPCVPGRNECPCEFALEDIKELNRCRCGLFVNGAYLEEHAKLKAQKKGQIGAKKGSTEGGERTKLGAAEEGETVEPKAKGAFLKKIVTNGFSITEEPEGELTLRPRGAEETAEVSIREVEPNVWKVVGASGGYAGFYRGMKRLYFEAYINQWAQEAALQSVG